MRYTHYFIRLEIIATNLDMALKYVVIKKNWNHARKTNFNHDNMKKKEKKLIQCVANNQVCVWGTFLLLPWSLF